MNVSEKIKKIQFCHLLLLLILITLFVGFFRKDIKIWEKKNLPRFITIPIRTPSTCTHLVLNPSYTSELKKINEARTKILEECELEKEKINYSDTAERYTLIDKVIDEKKCIESKKLPTNPTQYISEEYTCDKTTSYEKWFFAFGKKWFKVK